MFALFKLIFALIWNLVIQALYETIFRIGYDKSKAFDNWLVAVFTDKFRIMTPVAKIRLNGRIRYVKASLIEPTNTMTFNVTVSRGAYMWSSRPRHRFINQGAWQNIFWPWACSGSRDLGRALELVDKMATLLDAIEPREQLLRKAMLNLSASTDRLRGSGSSFAMLHLYISQVCSRLDAKEELLREAVETPLDAGGR